MFIRTITNTLNITIIDKSAVKKRDPYTPQFSSLHYRCLKIKINININININIILFKNLLLCLTFSVLVANPRELLYYTMANLARDSCSYYHDGMCKISSHQYMKISIHHYPLVQHAINVMLLHSPSLTTDRRLPIITFT